MNTKEIVKGYEDAMEKYHIEMVAYNKTMPKFNKESMEYQDIISRLIFVSMGSAGVADEYCFGADFYVTVKGFEKLQMIIDEIEVEVEFRCEPEKPCKPSLVLRTEHIPSGDSSLP